MSDLISRDALLEAVRSGTNPIDAISRAPVVTPQVVANISGGVLQGASCDYRVDVYCLDFDTGCLDDHSTGVMIDGSDAYRYQCGAAIEPHFVSEVVEAEEVYLLTGDPVEEDA
ncbi:hypothetical protein ACQKOE_07390 [Novosphingobium sp. NPDC080210]|uniref:hypothetical protein n=1 Tax=Novosphingobium sp. NPDC080210 TaxID=3390596 RepID=UPI003D076BDA